MVCLDFLSLEPSKSGVENILVISDHFTRYVQAFPTRNQTARTTARVLFENYIAHYGFPAKLHSDQGQSHPRVRTSWGDLFDSKWGVKINVSAEDTVVLLSQFSGIGCRILEQVGIFDISLKGFHIDGLQLTVCDGLRYTVTMVCRYFKISKKQKSDQPRHEMVIRTKPHTL